MFALNYLALVLDYRDRSYKSIVHSQTQSVVSHPVRNVILSSDFRKGIVLNLHIALVCMAYLREVSSILCGVEDRLQGWQ